MQNSFGILNSMRKVVVDRKFKPDLLLLSMLLFVLFILFLLVCLVAVSGIAHAYRDAIVVNKDQLLSNTM